MLTTEKCAIMCYDEEKSAYGSEILLPVGKKYDIKAYKFKNPKEIIKAIKKVEG